MIAYVEVSVLLLGSLIGSLITYSSFKGYKITGSPTLARLSLAFFFLSLGLILESLRGIFSIDLLFLEASLQTLGYFLLAFSHAINVINLQRMGSLSLLAPLNPLFTLRSLSVLFLLYSTTETFLSYLKEKRKTTLVIALGFSFLIVGEILRWLDYFYPPLSLIYLLSLTLKVIGFSTLLIPVILLATRGGKKNEL